MLPPSTAMEPPSIPETSSHDTSGIHGFLALCRTVDLLAGLVSAEELELHGELDVAPHDEINAFAHVVDSEKNHVHVSPAESPPPPGYCTMTINRKGVKSEKG